MKALGGKHMFSRGGGGQCYGFGRVLMAAHFFKTVQIYFGSRSSRGRSGLGSSHFILNEIIRVRKGSGDTALFSSTIHINCGNRSSQARSDLESYQNILNEIIRMRSSSDDTALTEKMAHVGFDGRSSRSRSGVDSL